MLVAIGVVGNVGAALHQLLVAHKVCAEHGEAVHGDGSRALPDVAADSRAVESALAAEAPDGHGHCGLSFNRRERFSLAPETSRCGKALASACSALVPAAKHQPRGVAALRLAPKTSPPPRA